MEPIRYSFRAMGTTVKLIAAPDSSAELVASGLRDVAAIFEREEQRFSRFRPDSELSILNSANGAWVRVSEPFVELTQLAVDAARSTGGLFDPTVLPALKAAGYDRDYDLIDEDLASLRHDFRALMLKNTTACGRWTDIEIRGDRIRLPRGAEIDFGGIAKGWTVDLAAERLTYLPWAIVDAGGDLRLVGDAADGLDIAVEDPEARGTEALRVRMNSGALATTSVTVRTWGQGLHHVIDPRTSLPALTGILQATVWGDTCAQAEVWSKAALLQGPSILDTVPASIVFETGEVVTNFPEANLVEPEEQEATA